MGTAAIGIGFIAVFLAVVAFDAFLIHAMPIPRIGIAAAFIVFMTYKLSANTDAVGLEITETGITVGMQMTCFAVRTFGAFAAAIGIAFGTVFFVVAACIFDPAIRTEDAAIIAIAGGVFVFAAPVFIGFQRAGGIAVCFTVCRIARTCRIIGDRFAHILALYKFQFVCGRACCEEIVC